MSVILGNRRPVLTWVVFVLLLLSGFLASMLSARQQLPSLQLGDYSHYRCATGNEVGELFRILTLSSSEAIRFADKLCADPVMSRYLSGVEIHWHSRAYLTARRIVEEEFDYVWNRRHLVEGLVPDYARFYRPLLDTPRYVVYWLSREPTLDLAAEDKVFGFLQDNHSQTFFLQPVRALKAAGLDLDSIRKVYYPDMMALYRAFFSGEVDIIANYQATLPLSEGQNYHAHILAEDVASGTLFLRQHWFTTALACRLQYLQREDLLLAKPLTALMDESECPEPQ